MRIKTFKDLIEEVHDLGICLQCGGCVSFCNSIENEIIGFKDPNLPPEFINKDKCLECGICYFICPQTHILDENLNKEYNFSNFSSLPYGHISNIYSCQATDKDFLKYGTDGGVVNSIINYLLEKKIIDGAIVAKTKSAFSRETMIAKSKDELINASGIKLDLYPQLDKVQKFHTYTSSLTKLKQYRFKRLALIGTPCQIYTIRCMQDLGINPSENIELCLGLFCYENFSFDKSKIKSFEKDFNLNFKYIERINIKENLMVYLKDRGASQKIIHIPFENLNRYMRPACNACCDFTNVYADISFGGLGSPDKFTTTITRTKKGGNIFSKLKGAGVIKCLELNIISKNKMKEKISQFCQFKMKRFENFMKNKSSDLKSLSHSFAVLED